jgi:hypothetical protein
MLFAMSYHHKFSITDLENMVPFEFDLFVNMVAQEMAKRQQAQQEQQNQLGL